MPKSALLPHTPGLHARAESGFSSTSLVPTTISPSAEVKTANRNRPATVCETAEKRLAHQPSRGVIRLLRDDRLASRSTLWLAGFLFAMLAQGTAGRAEDWPQWRGPRRDAVAHEPGLLTTWPDGGPPLAWKLEGLGTGYSSVVVQSGRVFTLGAKAGQVVVSACQAGTGELLWQTPLGATSRNPCSTPTADGARLFALGPDGQLACLDTATGEIRWRRDLMSDFGGRLMSGRGYGESPLVDGDRLICTPGGPDAELVALDKFSGAVVWQTRFPAVGPAGRDGAAFASCVPSLGGGVRQFVQLHGRGLVGVAADDGRLLWSYNAICNGTANIPTPVVHGDWVFAANGYNAGSVLLRLTPDPEAEPGRPGVRVTEVYTLAGGVFQNHHGGVVRLGNQIFGGHGSNNGLPTCLDLPTGRVLWKKRGPSTGSAAVIAVGQQLCFRYQTGLVALLTPTPVGFQIDGTLQIPGAGEDSWAHPVVAGGTLYLREQETLFAHDLREESSQPVGTQTRTSSRTRPQPGNDTATPPDAVVAALRAAGWQVRRLARLVPEEGATQSAADRWLELAQAPTDAEPPAVCRLRETQQTPSGSLTERAWQALQAVRGPLILDLQGQGVTPELLAQLVSLPNLVGLDLQLCGNLDEAGLAAVARGRGLRLLGLAGTGVSGDGLARLSDLPELVALDLEGCDGVTDETTEVLAQFRKLRGLSLRKTAFEKQSLTDAGLPALARLTQLEWLDLTGTRVTDRGMPELARLTRLRELKLGLVALTDAGLETLAPLRDLRRLDLPYSEGFAGPLLTPAAVPTLARFEKLQHLDLTGAKLTDAELPGLARLPDLRWLRLARTRVTAEGLQQVNQEAPKLEIRR